MNNEVSVIVPTSALASRAKLLRRALDSISSQAGVRPIALVIVNGAARDEALVAQIAKLPNVRLTICGAASLVRALHTGRTMVDTPWFAELDDDDVLLPGALAGRVRRLEQSAHACAVVTNGLVRGQLPEQPVVPNMADVARDPLRALRELNWLSPGGALFRTEAVRSNLFEHLPRFLEWTCLALRLARTAPIEFADELDFVHYEGSPDSLWGSHDRVFGLPAALRAMLAEPAPVELREVFARRLTSACNDAALLELRRGRLAHAWKWHLQCLRSSGGWRYLAFTRRLLIPAPGVAETG